MSGYENEERKTKFHELFATKIRISLVKTLILKKLSYFCAIILT